MAEEDHKVLQWFDDYATTQDTSDKDRAIRNRFVKLSDGERTAELQNLGSWFRDDSSLRAKSQLMKLGRELNNLHQAMRKVGR
jgi:hypothetical protein